MYLTKLTLDPLNAQARRDLADPYEMHRTLARVYAPDAINPPCRFLWRLERRADGLPSSIVLVQSAQPGDWVALSASPGYLAEIHADKPVDLHRLIQDGKRYRFRLLANPTVTRDGKRWGLAREEDQVAWLERQGSRAGFKVLGCLRAETERLQTRQGKAGQRIIVQTALFEGVLESTAEQTMREALQSGFGHAKSLGLGLLSLAKVVG